MITLDGIKRFYFIGIGGIGMSALARYFFSKGYAVAGYDKTPSPLTDELIEEGIVIHFSDLGASIPDAYKDTDGTLVVYTPAIPADMQELVYVQKNHKVLKRSEVLGLITQSSRGIGVAGTHGKTTTSTMLAYVLSQSSHPCSAFLGGISSNFHSNVLVDPKAEYSVIEADEFDRSFLKLSPFSSIITAMDPDHLDIYGTPEAFREGFQMYVDRHKSSEGCLLIKHGLSLKTGGIKTYYYGIECPDADFNGNELRYKNGRFFVDVAFENKKWKDVELGLPGIHNAENALAVIGLCIQLGLTEEEIRNGLKNFKGVKRRFEYHIKRDNLVYIDDYAHHPTEIEALVTSVRLLYPDQKISGIFQPHLFSRTRDFMEDFVKELAKLDEVIIMPIYPARENPIPGITSEVLVQGIGNNSKVLSPEQVCEWARNKTSGIVLTIGAGDIDRIVPVLTDIFNDDAK